MLILKSGVVCAKRVEVVVRRKKIDRIVRRIFFDFMNIIISCFGMGDEVGVIGLTFVPFIAFLTNLWIR